MDIAKLCRGCLLPVLLALAPLAAAQVRVTLTPYGATEVNWGDSLALRGDVFYTGPACPGTSLLPPMEGTLSLFATGGLVETPPFFTAFGRSCSNGQWTAQADFTTAGDLPFGTYVLIARYSGSSTLPAASSDPRVVRINPQFSWIAPDGSGVVHGGLSSRGYPDISCAVRQASLVDRTLLGLPMPPPNMRYPYEHVTFNAANCVSFAFGGAGPIRQSILLEFPADIPAGSQLWVHETTRDRPNPLWKPLAATFSGRFALATLEGASTSTFAYDSSFSATVALAIPQGYARDAPLQDLWWGGDAESGWGLNIAKNGQRIFATLFIYDDTGKAQWVVMPSGTWDPVHEVYYGDLYIPTGTSYASYDPYYFSMGNPIGTGSLSFATEDSGHFDYVIEGIAGGKGIGRYRFGPADGASTYAGMWWGGAAQDGWGLSIQQQGQGLFATWYTYGADRKTTWFYSAGGAWTSPTTYRGTLYRTTGSRWRGVTRFDSSSFRNIAVGTLQLDFSGPNAATMTTVVDGVTATRPVSRFPF